MLIEVRADGDAGSRRHPVSQCRESCQTIGPRSRWLWVWSLRIVQRWEWWIHMNMWRVGEDMGSKETDGCPLTVFGLSFLEPTARVSPKISSPQPSRIPRLSSQRTTNAHLNQEQFITEFHTSTPDRSFEFQEVPSYLALHNLLLPDYTSESNSDLTSQSSSLTSASTQHQLPVLPITMAAPSTMPPWGHGSTPKFTPCDSIRYNAELED
jgi:hypothetical protein